MRILFISRAYPPVTGGIENQNYALSLYLARHATVKTIANRHGRKFLPFFLPYATLRALVSAGRYDVVLLGDGVLASLGYFVKKFTGTPVVSVLHGLDINYNSASLNVWYEKLLIRLYQKLWVNVFLPSLDGYIAVSEETKRVGMAHHLPAEKIVVIPNGVTIPEKERIYERRQLEKLLHVKLENRFVLLTAGRLARRKGVAWFIRHVLPTLPDGALYVVAGAGPDQKNIEETIKESRMQSRVIMLGRVSDDTRDLLLHTADIFLQPNIRVAGDMEGFGLTVLEATVARSPVIASALEGLKEAIKDGENGLLLPPEDARAYGETIRTLLQSEEARRNLGEKAYRYAQSHYDWRQIARRYTETLACYL